MGATSNIAWRLIVEGSVVSIPSINSEIRDAGIIDFGRIPQPDENDRLIKRLAGAAALNALPPKAKAVRDQAEAIREARSLIFPR